MTVATGPTLKVLAIPGCTHDERGAKVRLPDGSHCCYWCYFEEMRKPRVVPVALCEWCGRELPVERSPRMKYCRDRLCSRDSWLHRNGLPPRKASTTWCAEQW